jgi:aerobic-type carbon monoxide dehydrogenase small subunit (CoxS/CutS family)
VCNGSEVAVDIRDGASLLEVLREQLGLTSVKDGCAPQGQCGCCTVLVDGAPRVACVTPATRIADRAVTTIEGLDSRRREDFAVSFAAAGGSQCGFCTPGIIMRFAGDRARDVDRGLAAHLCRCTGWLTVRDAITGVEARPRDLALAARRAELEGGVPQSVGADVALGHAPFADDTAPRDALVAVPLPPGSTVESVSAAGLEWVVGTSLADARARAGKVQGRRTTVASTPPLMDALPACPDTGVQLATAWVEPAYLEPDASWCAPGGEPASPVANGGAFGGKLSSAAPRAARELADQYGQVVRVVYSREDVVRLGPKRPPIAATAVARDGGVHIEGVMAAAPAAFPSEMMFGEVSTSMLWRPREIPGPPVSLEIRAAVLAECAMLTAGALQRELTIDVSSGAHATAHVEADGGTVKRVTVQVGAGDPLDEVVLRSYAIGAAHMALGWVLSEGLAVDPVTGEIHDLTIRSFGVLKASQTPMIDIEIVDSSGPPLARASDAVFAAVASSTWLALGCPVSLPVHAR